MVKDKFFISAFPLFLVLLIDGMGLGLLFPILNSIIVDPSSAFLPVSTTPAMRDTLYGFTVGIFMVCWFFGAAILGDLSDMIGRKKSLLICLLGTFSGYLLSAVAIVFHSLSVLIAGRVIAGFTSGSQPIAQAAIVDMSSPQDKARNIGLILLAISLGFIFGPMLGGVLSDSHFLSWFNFATPLYFASLVSGINAILLWVLFKESFKANRKIKIKFHHAIHVFISAFKHEKVRRLSLVLLIFIFGWSSYFTFISLFLLNRYHFSPLQVALFMAMLGVGFSIGCGILVDYLTKRYNLKKLIIISLLIAAALCLVTAVTQHIIYAVLVVIPMGAAIAVAYSVMITLFSDEVNENEQGWVMGVTGSIMALCFGITALFTGFIAQLGAGIPITLAAIGMAISAGILYLAG